MNTVERILDLMEKTKTTDIMLIKSIGLSNGQVGKWRNGTAKPSAENIKKLADYFNVSTDYLLGRTDDPQNKDNLKYALFHGSDGITDEMYEEVLRFAEFVKEKYNKNKGE